MESEKQKAIELINKFKEEFELYGVDNVWCEVSAKKQTLICINREIELIKLLLDESVNIHQSLSTPKKLCIDILNPKLKQLEEIKKTLTQ